MTTTQTIQPVIGSPELTALMRSASRLVSATVTGLSNENLQRLEVALAGGASVVMEVSPRPDDPRVRILLVEIEGARHVLAELILGVGEQKCIH